jgi:RNA polymerase sigma-70 factor (ECF subfamily)
VSQPIEVDAMAGASRTEPETRASAFHRLTSQHLDASYRLARAIVHDPADAEDAVQDALVRAWRKWPTLRDQGLFEHWFTRILVNTCRDHLRRRAVRPTAAAAQLAGIPSRDDPLAATHEREAMGAAMAMLSPEQRIVVALRFYRDLPVDEIARRLGVPSGTVQSRLHYALKRLNELIDPPERKDRSR